MAATAPQPNGHAAPASEAGSAAPSKIQPNDVGWQFVPQYYNFVNKQPHRLHCFYNKRSTFLHGEEGEEAQVALGQQEIHDRIAAIGYENCNVFIHSIDSQSSSGGGIIILVIGEIQNNGGPWRKFTQTFFLAEQPNGYFVLNDIFRYLKEEEEEDVDEEVAEQQIPVEMPAQATEAPSAPVPSFNAPPTPDSTEKQVAPSAGAGPAPVSAPAHPDPKEVPDEAVVASVPDVDQAPKEAPAAVEEPVTTAPPPPVDDTPAPSIATSSAKPAAAPAAPKANGAAPPAAAAATPAAPPKPAAPKTWASMAAAGSGAKSWAGMANQGAASSSAAPAPAPAAPAAAPKKEEAAAAASGSAQPAQPSLEGKHPFYINAMKTQTPHCFVKLPGWSSENQAGGDNTDEATVRAVSARFGEVKNVELVREKACAFVEFARVESARKAIAASLTVAQGGEGGVKIDGTGRTLSYGARKEKDERRPKAGGGQGGQGRGGAPGGGERGSRGPGGRGPQEGGERGGNSGRGRGGRGGRGGGMGGGDRQQQK